MAIVIDNRNPKDILGEKKVSLSKFPATALAHAAAAFANGAAKYGAYNWREKDVIAHVYVDAAQRHLAAWFEGEEVAADSGVHHLGHAIACLAIILDAWEHGGLVDDRPGDGDVLGDVLERVSPEGLAVPDVYDISCI